VPPGNPLIGLADIGLADASSRPPPHECAWPSSLVSESRALARGSNVARTGSEYLQVASQGPHGPAPRHPPMCLAGMGEFVRKKAGWTAPWVGARKAGLASGYKRLEVLRVGRYVFLRNRT
jgi:hypothetical protein